MKVKARVGWRGVCTLCLSPWSEPLWSEEGDFSISSSEQNRGSRGAPSLLLRHTVKPTWAARRRRAPPTQLAPFQTMENRLHIRPIHEGGASAFSYKTDDRSRREAVRGPSGHSEVSESHFRVPCTVTYDRSKFHTGLRVPLEPTLLMLFADLGDRSSVV